MKRVFGILLLLVIFSGLKAHPIKMTTGKLELKTSDKTCQLTLNFFIDDFEGELRKLYPQPSFNYQQPDEVMKGTILSYIQSNFELKINDKPVEFNLVRLEQIDQNVCQVRFSGQFQLTGNSNFATIKDKLLFSSFSKQSNILHLIVDNKEPIILQFYPEVPVRIEKFQ